MEISCAPRVIGEGGNLGVTALGRVEFDLSGGRINTDAMDNSAGVDCSDHEVNIKILIDSLVTAGKVKVGERKRLLESMTDEVAELVLTDNEDQNDLIGTSRANAASMLPVHAQQIKYLVEEHGLNRELEALPSEKEIRRRIEAGIGLSSPELCTLMANVKLVLKEEMLNTELPELDVFASRLPRYFPTPLRERFTPEIRTHQLRREIVTTMLINDLVDTAGISYAFRISRGCRGSVDGRGAHLCGHRRDFRRGSHLAPDPRGEPAGRAVGSVDAGYPPVDRPSRTLAAQLPTAAIGGGRRNQPVRRQGQGADATDVAVVAR